MTLYSHYTSSPCTYRLNLSISTNFILSWALSVKQLNRKLESFLQPMITVFKLNSVKEDLYLNKSHHLHNCFPWMVRQENKIHKRRCWTLIGNKEQKEGKLILWLLACFSFILRFSWNNLGSLENWIMNYWTFANITIFIF